MSHSLFVPGLVGTLAVLLAQQLPSNGQGAAGQADQKAVQGVKSPSSGTAGAATRQPQANPKGGGTTRSQSATTMTWRPGPMAGQMQPPGMRMMGPMADQMQPPGMRMMGMPMMGGCGRMMPMMMGGMRGQMNQGGQMKQGGQMNQGQMSQTQMNQRFREEIARLRQEIQQLKSAKNE